MKNKSRRVEIIEKSAYLFHKKGYAATSIRDIAKAMGMESASLYNHIKSKQEILQVILLPLAHRYTNGIKEIETAPLTSIQKLERIITDQIRITIENVDGVSLVLNEWVHLSDKQRNEFLLLRNYYENAFKNIFTACIKDEYLQAVNVDIAVFSILSTLRRLYSWYAKNQDINTIELEAELLTNLVGGLKV